MSMVIEDPETVAAIRDLAERTGKTSEETIRAAIEAARQREAEIVQKMAKVRELQNIVASWPKTGLKADKAFFDDLNGDS